MGSGGFVVMRRRLVIIRCNSELRLRIGRTGLTGLMFTVEEE
jgi:hypothetical protein